MTNAGTADDPERVGPCYAKGRNSAGKLLINNAGESINQPFCGKSEQTLKIKGAFAY
jgi:hypothetical protein